MTAARRFLFLTGILILLLTLFSLTAGALSFHLPLPETWPSLDKGFSIPAPAEKQAPNHSLPRVEDDITVIPIEPVEENTPVTVPLPGCPTDLSSSPYCVIPLCLC